MKKYSLFTLFLFFVINSNSQITISATDNVPVIGDEITYYYLDINGPLDVGDSGADVIWDFSNQTENGELVHKQYVDPTGLPYVEEMPLADLAVNTSNNTNNYEYYFTQGGTLFKQSGSYFSSNPPAIYFVNQDISGVDHPLEVISYPITYGFSNTHQYMSEGNIPIDPNLIIMFENGEYSYEVDGWGKLILPHKTYNYALRVHNHKEHDQIWYQQGNQTSGPFHQVQDSYTWYVPEIKGTVLNYTVSAGPSYTNYSAAWHRENTSSISENSTNDNINIFPNPTNGVFFVISDSCISVLVSDTTGKEIYYVKNKSNNIEIDLSDQNAGIYLIRITKNNNVINKKVILK